MYTASAIFVTLIASCYSGYPYGAVQYGPPAVPVPAAPVYAAPAYNDYGAPTPYSFGYNAVDAQGTKTSRQETGDGNGAVKGSYSYIDAYGISRLVEYVADDNGFRANIKTNEPGTETSAPADTIINAAPIAVSKVAPVIAAPAPVSVAYAAPAPTPLGYPAAYPAPLPIWPPVRPWK